MTPRFRRQRARSGRLRQMSGISSAFAQVTVSWREAVFAGAVQSSKLLERIKYSESGTPEVAIVAGRDRQSMPSGGRRDVTVLDGHALSSFVEQPLLVGPHVCNGHIEAVNS